MAGRCHEAFQRGDIRLPDVCGSHLHIRVAMKNEKRYLQIQIVLSYTTSRDSKA